MNNKYDLVVAYRIYPKISKIPPAFPADKYKLAELCLDSFKKSIEGLKVKIYVLLDNCPKEYEKLFLDRFPIGDIELMNVNLGNKGSFKKQIEILSSQNESEIVYFAEDDYFYIDNIKEMVELIKSGSADFVTPYEHPSCYSDGHVVEKQTISFGKRKYISAQHTCLTFMTSKSTLKKNKRYLKIFSDWFGSDFVVWGCVTLGNKYFRYIKLLTDPKKYTLENIKVFGVMFVFAIHRFIFNKKYRLYMPVNTIATHMERNFLSPNIDWNSYFETKK